MLSVRLFRSAWCPVWSWLLSAKRSANSTNWQNWKNPGMHIVWKTTPQKKMCRLSDEQWTSYPRPGTRTSQWCDKSFVPQHHCPSGETSDDAAHRSWRLGGARVHRPAGVSMPHFVPFLFYVCQYNLVRSFLSTTPVWVVRRAERRLKNLQAQSPNCETYSSATRPACPRSECCITWRWEFVSLALEWGSCYVAIWGIPGCSYCTSWPSHVELMVRIVPFPGAQLQADANAESRRWSQRSTFQGQLSRCWWAQVSEVVKFIYTYLITVSK